jgi:hypothetical protein
VLTLKQRLRSIRILSYHADVSRPEERLGAGRNTTKEKSMVIPSLGVRLLFTLLPVSLSFPAPSFAGASVYNFTLPSIDGEPTSLSSYKGKVILLVNVASRCGFTPQYSALESL